MLSLSPIRASASGASQYYLAEEKHLHLPNAEILPIEQGLSTPEHAIDTNAKYYLAETQLSEGNTQWFGGIAEKEGILGEAITEEKLQAVLNGELDNTKTQGAHSDQRRKGYDLTFSAPKGASILALVYGDTRITEAFNESVKVALSEIEKDTAQYRTTDKTTHQASYENSSNLLFGMVQHKTSREEEPQLHVHALMANMTYDKNDNLKNLASSFYQQGNELNGTYERILANQKYYGMILHSDFGSKLENMGYSIKSMGNGQIDIDGIPQEVIDANSTRRSQLLAHTKELGIDSSKSRDYAAQLTRKPKSYTPEQSLQKEWNQKNNDLGFNGLDFVTKSFDKPAPIERPIPETAKAALDKSIAHLSNTQNSLGYEKVLTLAAGEFSYGKHHNIIDLKTLLDDKIKQEDLIPLNDQKTHFTTPTLIENEQNLIKDTQGRMKGISIKANDKSMSDLRLNEQSREVVSDLFASKKAVNVVNLTGASKQLSEALLHVGTQSGRNMVFVAQSVKDKQQLTRTVKRQSFSVMEWVKNSVKQEHVTTVQGLLNAPPAKNNKDTVLVVEHANKLGVDDTRALMQKAKADGSKLIFLNHTAGSKGFKAGHAVDTLQKGNVYSTEWKNAKPSQTAVLIHEAEKAPRQQDIAMKYAALSNDERSQTQVLTTNQTDSKQLNKLIRDTLDKQGQLSEKRLEIDTLNPVFMSKEQQTMAKSYKAGMVLTEFTDGKRDRFTVTNVFEGANSLQLVNEQGIKSSVNMDSKRSFMVASPAKLEIARGDKLQVNANVFGTELKQHDSMTVEKINWLGVQFKADDGSRHVVGKDQLHQSALTYGYANTINQAKSDKAVTLVDITSFTASKETLHDLLSTDTKQLHFFTENSSKLEHKLDKSNIQPTAISRVLHADNAVEKYVNAQTSKALFNDVSIALNNINERHVDKGIVHDAVQFALNHVSEQQAGFTHTELISQAMIYATEERGQPVKLHEIKQQLDTLEKNGTVFSAEYHDQTRWTTKESLETEQRILNTIAEGRNTKAPLVTEKAARDFLAAQPRMTDGQKDAITLITTTRDQFVGIQGFAGTGKSTMLEQGINLVGMAQGLLDDKTEFIGLAPTHAAVNELKNKGVTSQTTQSLLQDYKTGALEPSRLSNTVFLLDESSMSSNKQLDSYTQLIKESGASSVMLGDIHQLQSSEAGKPSELAFSKQVMQTSVMKDIVRQQNEATLNAVKHVIDKQVHSTLGALKEQQPLPIEQYQPETKQLKDEIDQKPASINKSQNVISTFETITGNYKQDTLLATQKLYVEAAAEYLSRTPESRANTLLIVYTHREGDLLAGMIRDGLQQTNELSTDEQQVTRLRGVGATQESLKTMMPYKKGIVINTGREDYFEISHVNKAHQLLEVTNMHTGESSVIVPKHHDHTMTTLWSKDSKPLTIGDEITWRKTDKSLELQGNTDLTVTALDNKTMTITSTNGKEIQLPRDNMQSSHWDYRYTRTSNSSQGSTFKNVITVIDANAKLTNIRRGYIDISRASEHVKLFTNHESSLIKSWINNKDDNTSAIETLEKTDMHHTPYFDINTKPQDNPLYQVDGQFRLSLYGKAVETELSQYTESVAKHVLGQPNKSKSDKDYLVFGSGDSHIKISLTGEYRGFYRDWTTGDKGSLINLIADTQNISYKEAVAQAGNYLAEPEKFNLVKNENHEKLLNTLTKQMSQFKERATEYFVNGKDIEGTPAQAYLERFNASNTPISNHSELRYHDNVYSSDSQTTHPALISKLSNNQQGLEAAEITYLTEDGELANLKTPKRLMGNKSTHSVNIHEGSTNISVISVGIEQALSFNNENKHDVDIIAVNNPHDLRTVDMSSLRDDIIILMGNNKANEKLTTEVVDRMAERGYSVSIINDAMKDLNHNEQHAELSTNDIANQQIAELTQQEQVKHTELEQLAKEILSNNEQPLPDNDTPQLNAKQSDAINMKDDAAIESFERASIPDKQISKDDRTLEYDELTK